MIRKMVSMFQPELVCVDVPEYVASRNSPLIFPLVSIDVPPLSDDPMNDSGLGRTTPEPRGSVEDPKTPVRSPKKSEKVWGYYELGAAQGRFYKALDSLREAVLGSPTDSENAVCMDYLKIFFGDNLAAHEKVKITAFEEIEKPGQLPENIDFQGNLAVGDMPGKLKPSPDRPTGLMVMNSPHTDVDMSGCKDIKVNVLRLLKEKKYLEIETVLGEFLKRKKINGYVAEANQLIRELVEAGANGNELLVQLKAQRISSSKEQKSGAKEFWGGIKVRIPMHQYVMDAFDKKICPEDLQEVALKLKEYTVRVALLEQKMNTFLETIESQIGLNSTLSNQGLLVEIFECGLSKVDDQGRLCISLRNSDKYKNWEIERIASEHKWKLIQKVPVPLEALGMHGYKTVRTSDMTVPVKFSGDNDSANLYVFAKLEGDVTFS